MIFILLLNKVSLQSNLQTVEAGDLKPPPVLWHEDSGRRPHDNSNRYFVISSGCFCGVPMDKLESPDLVQSFLGTTHQEQYRATNLERQLTD
jgi:hypothetical protein